MEKQRLAAVVVCPENESLAAYMWNKREELAQSDKGVTENVDMTISKAYSNVCRSKTAIKTLRDLAHIKGVGKWILRLMQGFFETDSGASEDEEFNKKGKKTKGTKRYMPQKNSVTYALLITLYRGTINGNDFMHKQELIDSAEASGLSRAPILAEKGKLRPGQFGSSPRDWYSGWSCMKTLISKGIVVKSNCPAKYMLTEEGKEAARECLLRSGLVHSTETLETVEGLPNLDKSNTSGLEFASGDSQKEVMLPSIGSSSQQNSMDISPESLKKFVGMGYSNEQIVRAFCEVAETSQNKEISSLWQAVLCHLREGQVYGLPLNSLNTARDCLPTSTKCKSRDGKEDLVINKNRSMNPAFKAAVPEHLCFPDSSLSSYNLRACSSFDYPMNKPDADDSDAKRNVLAMPPLTFGERFEDVYEVILILDDREQFATQGSRSRKTIENICSQFKIKIQVNRLPVGDGIWIARHKYVGSEYVLDFIVERKKIDDLRCSIRDNRYRDQKQRLVRCGLKKLIYLVEGDPNSSEAAESIKTACFTTEILEGFDVQRTSGLGDTLRKYGHLTQAIAQYYQSVDLEDREQNSRVCPPFDVFIKRCQDLDKMTVSDVFAIQLMQVPQVTEDVAIAVLDLYPTLLSLARAYSLLDGGDVRAQEEMLKKQSNNAITGVASRNIFQLIWGS